MEISANRSSGALVLFIPEHWLPQFHFVSVGIHDPGELSVFSRFGTADDFDSVRAELCDQFVEVVDAVIDHESGVARAEPFGITFRDAPDGESLVLGLVIRPSQHRAAPAFEWQSEVFLIPRGKCSAVVCALEKDAAD